MKTYTCMYIQMILIWLGVHSICLVQQQRNHVWKYLLLFWEQKAAARQMKLIRVILFERCRILEHKEVGDIYEFCLFHNRCQNVMANHRAVSIAGWLYLAGSRDFRWVWCGRRCPRQVYQRRQHPRRRRWQEGNVYTARFSPISLFRHYFLLSVAVVFLSYTVWPRYNAIFRVHHLELRYKRGALYLMCYCFCCQWKQWACYITNAKKWGHYY